MNSVWKATEADEKFGIAIANFDGSLINDGLDVTLSQFVHIYEKCENWYRGCLYHQHYRLGIFPRNIISLKNCKMNSAYGLNEQLIPELDPLILTINHFTPFVVDELLETYENRAQSSVNSNTKDDNLGDMYSLQSCAIMLGSRYQKEFYENQSSRFAYLSKKSTLEHHWESNLKHFKVKNKNFHSLVLPKSSPASLLYPEMSDEKTHNTSEGRHSYHLYLEKREAIFSVSSRMQIVIGTFSAKSNEYTSELLTCDTMKNPNINICSIFKDVSVMEEEHILLIKVFRIGKLVEEKSDKLSVDCRRPLFYGVLDLKAHHDFLDRGKNIEIILHPCPDSEFCILEGKKLKQQIDNSDGNENSITFKMKRYFGTIDDVMRIPDIAAMKDIIMVKALPREDIEKCEDGNEGSVLYIHLKKVDIDKMSKGKKDFNIRVQLAVFAGQNCLKQNIFYGSSKDPIDEYFSPVLYHNNSPVYNDLIKVYTPNDVADICLRFFIRHLSRNPSKHRMKSDLAYTVFIPVVDKLKTLAVPNDIHMLNVHDIELIDIRTQISKNGFVYLGEYIPTDDKGKPGQSDYVLIRSHLVCDGYTTNKHISNFLAMDHNDKAKISELTSALESKVRGVEKRKFCVKILHTIWQLLESDVIVPEIYDTTIKRFREMKSVNVDRDELKKIFVCIENVDAFYQYFMDNIKTSLIDYQELKTFQQTLKLMDILLMMLSSLVEHSTVISKEKFSQDLFDILMKIEIKKTAEDLHKHNLYGSELPNILMAADNILSYKQQVSIVESFFNSSSTEPWVNQMKLYERIIEMPLFHDKECHEKICGLFSTFITAVSSSNDSMLLRAYYLHTYPIIKLLEKHSEFLKDDSSNDNGTLVRSLYFVITSLHLQTCKVENLPSEWMMRSILCLVSFLKLITADIFNLLYANRDPVKIANQLCLTFQKVTSFKDIPPNYDFHWGMVYAEVNRVFTLLHCCMLADLNAGKIRHTSCNKILRFAIDFVLVHEEHLSKFSRSLKQDYSMVYGKISFHALYLIQSLFEGLKGDLMDKQKQNHLKDFLRICLLPYEGISDAAIRVLLEIMKVTLTESSDPTIVESFSSELTSIIYTHLNDITIKSSISFSDFIIKYKKIADSFWNSDNLDAIVGEKGKKLFLNTSESFDHMHDQRNLPVVTLSPFLTLFITFKDVLYNLKRDLKLLPVSLLRYVSMLLQMKFYEEAGFAMTWLADKIEPNDNILEEISFTDLYATAHDSKSDLDTSFQPSTNVVDELKQCIRLAQADSTSMPTQFPRQNSLVRRFIFLRYAVNFFTASYNRFFSVKHLKAMVEYLDSFKNPQLYGEISAIYQELVSVYTYTITSPALTARFYHVGFYGQDAPEKVRNMEFIYIGHFSSILGEIMRELGNEFPDADVGHQSKMTVEELKAQKKFVIKANSVLVHREIPDDENLEKNVQNISGEHHSNMFYMDYCYKFDSTFTVNDHSERGKYKIVYTTESMLPGHLRMSEVENVQKIKYLPIETAIETLKNKTMELIQYKTVTDKNKIYMMLNGIIDAAVNGGTKMYIQAFLCPKYQEAYPDHQDKIDIMKFYLKTQMDHIKDHLNNLLCQPSDSNRGLLERLRDLYNTTVTYYKQNINVDCTPVVVTTPAEAEFACRGRTDSCLSNSGVGVGVSPQDNVGGISSSPQETSKLSSSLSSSIASVVAASTRQQDKKANLVTKKLLINFGSLRRPKMSTKIASGAQTLTKIASSQASSSLTQSSSLECHQDPSTKSSSSSTEFSSMTNSKTLGKHDGPSNSSEKAGGSALKTLFSKRS